MSLRGDRIKRARARVNARARDRAADINRSAAIKRYSTTPIKSPSFKNRKYNQQGGKRWDRRLANTISDIFSGATEKAKTGIMGPYATMAKAGKELFIDPIMKASENKQILGDALTDNLRESVMTPSDDAFYKKYMRLADLATDNQERERLIKEANTALRNAQISSRINYGLGQLGKDTLGKEGFDSYKQPMFGEAAPRFNMDNFMTGLASTPTGKAFLAEAEKAQAEESGESSSPIATAMKKFTFTDDPTTFVGGDEFFEGMAIKDPMNPQFGYEDVAYFDPYLSPNTPFFPKGETYYENYLQQFK